MLLLGIENVRAVLHQRGGANGKQQLGTWRSTVLPDVRGRDLEAQLLDTRTQHVYSPSYYIVF